ncbi:MAG: hypothetical protein J6Y02_12910 [Pseudobutyrivibrio sp.]|nr:hypothetical protein [Pseudobutyrivibrio sp.]
MPDPNYIDEIQFSDETFKIRDSEARDLIAALEQRVEDLENQLNNQGGQ